MTKCNNKGMPACTVWARWVRDQRRARRMTRRELARLACVDPSLMTIIERDGHIPRRDIVSAIGAALLVNHELALIVAGYLPDTMRNHAERILATRQMMDLPLELQSIIHKLHAAPKRIRDKAAAYIDGLMADLI